MISIRIQEFAREIVFGNLALLGRGIRSRTQVGDWISSQALAGQRKAP